MERGELATLYRIRNWNKLYENSESKKIKNARYVLVPNHHDGKGFRRLLRLPEKPREHPDGVRMFSAWILILQIASKCAERGVLADEDGPLTAEDMSLKTGAPQDIFEGALRVLSGKDFKWIEATHIPESSDDALENQDNARTFPHRTERNGTIEIGSSRAKSPPVDMSSCEKTERGFSPHYQQALDAWKEEREKVGLTFVADPQTKDGARIIAGMIENGQANLGAVRKAMENLLANEEARSTYTLKGLANNLSTWIDGGGKSGGKNRRARSADGKHRETRSGKGESKFDGHPAA
jgi:hypothetical protein